RSVQPSMELGEDRRALRLAQLEVRFPAERRLALAHAALDRVQPPDEVQRDARPALCMGLHFARFFELATRMRPAARVRQALGSDRGAVSLVAVGEQHAAEALEQTLRDLRAARGIVVEQ